MGTETGNQQGEQPMSRGEQISNLIHSIINRQQEAKTAVAGAPVAEQQVNEPVVIDTPQTEVAQVPTSEPQQVLTQAERDAREQEQEAAYNAGGPKVVMSDARRNMLNIIPEQQAEEQRRQEEAEKARLAAIKQQEEKDAADKAEEAAYNAGGLRVKVTDRRHSSSQKSDKSEGTASVENPKIVIGQTTDVEPIQDADPVIVPEDNSDAGTADTIVARKPGFTRAERDALMAEGDVQSGNEWITDAEKLRAMYPDFDFSGLTDEMIVSSQLILEKIGQGGDQEPLPEDLSDQEIDILLTAEGESLTEAERIQLTIDQEVNGLEETVLTIDDLTSQLNDHLDGTATAAEVIEDLGGDPAEDEDIDKVGGLRGWALRRKRNRARRIARGQSAGRTDYDQSLLGKIYQKMDEDDKRTADKLRDRKDKLKKDAKYTGLGIAAALAGPLLGPILAAGAATKGTYDLGRGAGTLALAGMEKGGKLITDTALELGGGIRENTSKAVVAATEGVLMGTPEGRAMLERNGLGNVAELESKVDALNEKLDRLLANQQQN